MRNAERQGSDHTLFDDAFLKKIEYLYIMSKKVFVGKLRAERKTKKVATGIEFADYRNYAPGDDFRTIDWRVFGRTEKLLVRLFEEKEDLQIAFLIDVSGSMQFGGKRLDYAKRMAAALSYMGLCNMDRVSFLTFNNHVTDRMLSVSGRGQIFKIFRFLEGVQAQGETNFEDVFKTFAGIQRRRGLAVVLSDFGNPTGYENALNFLHFQQYETYVVHIVDHSEFMQKERGDVTLVDVETGGELRVTLTKRLWEQYRRVFEAWGRQIEGYCVKRNMLYVQTPVDVPFDDIVLKIFRAGGFLKS
jgi:uncharacterized protein (DUF58 family)